MRPRIWEKRLPGCEVCLTVLDDGTRQLEVVGYVDGETRARLSKYEAGLLREALPPRESTEGGS
jgi:hypothetical protein